MPTPGGRITPTPDTYDALNRLTRAVYTQSGQATRTYTWTYDQTGAPFGHGIGRLTTAGFVGGNQTYQYDALGRITSTTRSIQAISGGNSAAVSHTTGYEYTPAGQLQRITYPSGRQIEYTYTQGQLSAIGLKPSAGGTVQPLLSNVAYSPFGPVERWDWQMSTGAKAHQRYYDTYGRLVRYRIGTVWRDITYDAANRITRYTHYSAIDGSVQSSLNQSFGYDELGRLTSVSLSGASWGFSYDANGNRTQHVLNGTAVPYTVSPTSNRLTAVQGSTVRNMGHDAVGNTTADTYSAVYSLENRLQKLTKGSTTSTYTYDHNGQRVRKFQSTGASTTVFFVYDQAGQLLGEYNQAGQAIKEYVWLGSTPVAVFTPDPTNAANPPIAFYIHADHLDTPRMVLDRNDKRRWRWLAEPFGTTAPENNPDGLGAFTFNLRFPGQYADQESGLYYNWFRDYDATIGRYIESDPIGLDGGINTYIYVDGNPLWYVDPNGLNPAVGVYRAGQLGWNIGTSIYPYVASPLASAIDAMFLPDPFSDPMQMAKGGKKQSKAASRTISWPDKIVGQWSCTARADCNDNIPGNCPDDPSKRFAFGSGTANDLGTARNIAKANATSNLQCQPKHVSCKCTGPKGNSYSGGC